MVTTLLLSMILVLSLLCLVLFLKQKNINLAQVVYVDNNQKEDEIDRIFKKKGFKKSQIQRSYTYGKTNLVAMKHDGIWYMIELDKAYQKVDLELKYDSIFSLVELWSLYAKKLNGELKKSA